MDKYGQIFGGHLGDDFGGLPSRKLVSKSCLMCLQANLSDLKT
jgi:hypothetical protein